MDSHLVRSPEDKLVLQLAPEEVRGQPCGTEPLTWGIRCYLQTDRVSMDLNCRTLSWSSSFAWLGRVERG